MCRSLCCDHVVTVKSLVVFTTVYSTDQIVDYCTVTIDGQVPILPPGVLDKTDGMNQTRFTWRPKHDVRIATIITKYKDGFVLTGRNMREVEDRIIRTGTIVGLAWAVSILAALTLFGIKEIYGKRKS